MSTPQWRTETQNNRGFHLGDLTSESLLAIVSKLHGGETRSRYGYVQHDLEQLNYSTNENGSALYLRGSHRWSALLDLPAPVPKRAKGLRYSVINIEGTISPLGQPPSEEDPTVSIYFNDRGLSLGVEYGNTAPGAYGFRTNDANVTYRTKEQVQDYELSSALYISFKSTKSFKSWINSCRKSRLGRMINSSTTAVAQCDFPGFGNKTLLNEVKGVTSVTITGGPITGLFDYNTVYPFLYGRRAIDGGLFTYYDNNDISYTVEGVGVTSYGSVYIHIIVGGMTVRLICPRSVHSDDDFGEMPDVPDQVTVTTQQEIVVIDDPVATIEVAAIELTQEQQDRLVVWEIAHITYCEKRSQSVSASRQVWFSHYVMSLISDGAGPDELDENLINLL
jgi:hypothetical protein